MIIIEPESDQDGAEIERLLDVVFTPSRTALSSYRLREGVRPIKSLARVARNEIGAIVGTIRAWPVVIGDEAYPCLLLGPIAVHAVAQGEGLGGSLIMELLTAAKAKGWQRVILIGDEPYYQRFGFTRKSAAGLIFPQPTNPQRLLANELESGAMKGVVGEVCRWPEAGE